MCLPGKLNLDWQHMRLGVPGETKVEAETGTMREKGTTTLVEVRACEGQTCDSQAVNEQSWSW
jgi:hypothetical protein